MIRTLFALLIFLCLLPVAASAQIFDEPDESDGSGESAPVPRYEPDSEALRSVLLPGWSQYRQGYGNSGFAYASIAVLSGIVLFGLVDMPIVGDDDDNFGRVLAGSIYGLNAVVSGFDAHRRASDSNRENGWDLEQAAHRRAPGVRVALLGLRF